MLARFTTITNRLFSLGKLISNDQKVRKIIRAFLKSWEVKATVLKELNDNEEIDFTAFVGNLKTHEMKMKVRKNCEPQKIGIAFKALQENKKKLVSHQLSRRTMKK